MSINNDWLLNLSGCEPYGGIINALQPVRYSNSPARLFNIRTVSRYPYYYRRDQAEHCVGTDAQETRVLSVVASYGACVLEQRTRTCLAQLTAYSHGVLSVPLVCSPLSGSR